MAFVDLKIFKMVKSFGDILRLKKKVVVFMQDVFVVDQDPLTVGGKTI